MTIIPGNVVISEAESVRLVCCGLRRCGKLETCGSLERDHISCHNDNYSISAISINHIIIRCAISTGAVITICSGCSISGSRHTETYGNGNDASSFSMICLNSISAVGDPEQKPSWNSCPAESLLHKFRVIMTPVWLMNLTNKLEEGCCSYARC